MLGVASAGDAYTGGAGADARVRRGALLRRECFCLLTDQQMS